MTSSMCVVMAGPLAAPPQKVDVDSMDVSEA